MCLYTKKRNPRIANRDITCYKVVYVRGGKYYAPCVRSRIAKRYIIGRCLYYAHGKPVVDGGYYDIEGVRLFAIGKGFIHTYGRIDVAFSQKRLNREVYECIIPKGSEYYKDYASYELASTAIRFVRRIEPLYEKIKF